MLLLLVVVVVVVVVELLLSHVSAAAVVVVLVVVAAVVVLALFVFVAFVASRAPQLCECENLHTSTQTLQATSALDANSEREVQAALDEVLSLSISFPL